MRMGEVGVRRRGGEEGRKVREDSPSEEGEGEGQGRWGVDGRG